MITRTGTVAADYSQIELHLACDGEEPSAADVGAVDDSPGLVNAGDWLTLTTARQYGQVPVEVQVHPEPVPLDPSWDAVHEASMQVGADATVTGWAGEGTAVDVPVQVPGLHRVRYVVVDGQAGSDWFRDPARGDEQPCERYLLQLWPEPAPRDADVVAAVPWAQYWAFGPDAARLVSALVDVPDPERLVVLLDAALAAHPDVAAHLRAGDDDFTLGLVRYAQELFRLTHASPVYAEQRADHDGLLRLIRSRV